MTVAIKCRGELEPVEVTGDFNAMKADLDLMAAKGWSFVVLQRADNDRRIAFSVPNILTIEDLEESEDVLG